MSSAIRKILSVFIISVCLTWAESTAHAVEGDTEDDPSLADSLGLDEPAQVEAKPASSEQNETAAPIEHAPNAHTFTLDIKGDITFTPREDEKAGGMDELTVSYRLSAETEIPDILTKQTLTTSSKIETQVEGALFTGNTIVCELRLEIPEARTELEITPQETQAESQPGPTAGSETLPDLHVQIRWSEKIEETWESACPISTTYTFTTVGEPEIPFDTLLRHADPPLSSFVLSEDKKIFHEEFVLEYFDDATDPVYEVSGSGRGTLTISPK